ncbi:MAG: OB-fold nucleic acid binding domain-containing protein [Promethearchaeota archaeon]
MKKVKREYVYTPVEARPGFCPNCGAYVGAFYSCPECGSKMPHGTRLRVTQITSFVAVIIGIIGLSIYAQIEPAPLVNIGDIGPTYSNGVVIIEGTITNIDYREASDESWRMVIFTVEDNTGSIDVKVYTEATNDLIKEKNTPAIGDKCRVRGTVYIKGEDMYLILEASYYLTIIREIDYSLTAKQLYQYYNSTPDQYLGKRVEVTGEVTYVGGDGSYFDLDDVIRIYFPDYVREFAPNVSISVIVGDQIKVVGIVQEYYDIVEVLPGSMYDFEIISHGGVED